MIRLWRRQEIRYLLVGGYNTVFGFVLFAGAHLLLPDVPYLLLLVPAMVVAVLNAFFAYRWLVFGAAGHWFDDLRRFSMAYVGLFAANLALLPLLVELGGLPVLLAQAIVLALTVISGFFTHRGYSFRGASDPSTRASAPEPDR